MKPNRTIPPIPPKFAKRLLLRFLRSELAEEVQGDLEEKFYAIVKNKSLFKAKVDYWYQVLNYIRPFAISKLKLSNTNHYDMFQNYFKIAWRNLLKQRMYSVVKIGGFALGIAICLLIALFIRNELSHDKFYVDGNRIYRMHNVSSGPDGGKWTAFPAPVAQLIKHDFPEIEKAGRLIPYDWFDAGSNLFRREDQLENAYEEKFAYADQSLIEILEIPMVYGSRTEALSKPNTIILSKRKADKYFPNENPVGRTVIFNDNTQNPYTVGGVFENFSPLSHLQFEFLITLTEKEFWSGEQTSWCCWNYNVYFKIRPDANPRDLEKKLLKLRDSYYASYLEQEGNQKALEDVKKHLSFAVQPVSDIYLKSEDLYDLGKHGDMKYIWLFGGIACFILLLACINFINLSTARSANRAREVGLRKTVGSFRSHLIRQFLTESILFSLISFALGLVIASAVLPYFNTLADKHLTIPVTEWWFIPTLLLAVIVIGIIAGIYPAFYLSAFKPIDVLKGGLSRGAKNSTVRSIMVVFQFATSIVLIIGTFVIYQQMHFILNTKVGFEKDQVLLLHGANTLGDKQETFREELQKLSPVQNVTITDYLPVAGTKRDQNGFFREGKSKEETAVGAQKWYADVDYIPTMGMKLSEGRNFDEKIASDSQAIIINQAMAKEFGFKNPIGERIMNWETYTIIGVVEDFNFESLRGNVEPLCLVLGKFGSILAVKVKTGDMKGTLESVTGLWTQFMPNQPIRYAFLDESYARMYDDVQRTGRIFTSFAVLAVIVACLGLFALSTFMIEQRGKEISIRIVLGASLNHIFRLLTGNFVKLVMIAFVIAIPIAWYMMRKWLEDYKNKIDLGWDVFVIAGLMAVLIALLTISQQAIRAALTNPVKNLKSE
jgi:putative ABC transport system permease protein